ncbi:aspartate/glutamate racemase family protein [Kocuria marina]|uniref:aspartate/glutamate racemase family protein n=1 Tax=Kocuria marina TaxID=223184 RepID=UPI0038CD7EDE
MESYLAAVGVMDAVASYDQPFDAVIQAGFGEHGREGLQEMLDQPVVDITGAAAAMARFVGRSYTGSEHPGPHRAAHRGPVAAGRADERCASVRAPNTSVLDLERDENAAVETIVAEAQRAIEQGRSRGGCPRLRRDGRP